MFAGPWYHGKAGMLLVVLVASSALAALTELGLTDWADAHPTAALLGIAAGAGLLAVGGNLLIWWWDR